MLILERALRFAQTHFNVGDPSRHFCLLRCLDIVSPVMLIQRRRSNLEVGFKTICLATVFVHVVGLMYDFCRQRDIRAAMDVFCMLSLFVCILMRTLYLRNFQSDISLMERLDANPRFREGTPYGDAIRQQVVHKDNVILGTASLMHMLTVTIYVWQNMFMSNSFLSLITYWPTKSSDGLDKLAQFAYSLVGYIWGWTHGSGQYVIIVLLRIAIAEFKVFLHSLATLDHQISLALMVRPELSLERIVRDLLQEHARRHRELIVVMMRLRAMLRIYSLVHFFFYMTVVAAFMTRILLITGKSSLGMALPPFVMGIFLFETLALCLLVENLIQLNRLVSFMLYSFNWTPCLPFGRSIRSTMLLMIMQSNNTADFSAGGLTTVSAELFTKSCRLIYTMMMCMSNLAKTGT